ncbi:MAG: helix-turn-helix transcriptional regulator [Elusimicrobia bacterium]|nr:helix-turn-helix transcriptional regulator [Elusimicrobiota bacterium]
MPGVADSWRKLRLTPAALAAAARVGPNALLNLERGDAEPKEWVVGRILKAFGDKVREAFPGAKDVYDFLIPPKDFASWLRNFRLRRGLQQSELAKALGVTKVTIFHYERNVCKPRPVIQQRLRRVFSCKADLDRFL